ncbi:Hypothetical protein R9X50_00128500 [Acrodontium crateriforme]|uniref:Uncharacterized protein n=1 Tax=Acrodontium crateriforme TaxID=150365 RepID=A0AAQ3LZ41_9PEZI|nr:Hypothetical protein R9X50_00128500 [Acrodontium crateriforme]
MLLTTGIIALSRKVNDDRVRKKEARQGRLRVGNSEVARQTFQSQIVHSSPEDAVESRYSTGIQPEIKYDNPSDIVATTTTEAPTVYSPIPTIHETTFSSTSDFKTTSPVESQSAILSSPMYTTSIRTTPRSEIDSSDLPPSYSEGRPSTFQSPSSIYSGDTGLESTNTTDTHSILTTSSDSNTSNTIRVKTKGSDLNSGFPYHPALFECNIHPEKWDSFTTQVIHTTKFTGRDRAQIWAASAATAITGAIGTSIWLGRTMSRQTLEKKFKAGLSDMQDGGLGFTLQQWNDGYFGRRGLYVHLELSESAMKSPNQQSKTLQKSALLYSNKEDRDRKREERKYVIVVTKLTYDGMPSDAVQQFPTTKEKVNTRSIAELPGNTEISPPIVELPGNEPVELPAMDAFLPGNVSLGFAHDAKSQPPLADYAELHGSAV